MSDDLSATALMIQAADGDKQAWDTLVERYASLVWSICCRYQLSNAAAGDAGRAVWHRLAGHLDKIREPAALTDWLVTTTRRECDKVRRTAHEPRAAENTTAAEAIPKERTAIAEHELLAAGRHAALREALTRLPPCCRQLIALLTEDPSVPHDQISAKLGIPVRSIGPRRGRCLDRLRRDPAIATLLKADPAAATGLPSQQAAVQR